jgi:tRNA dimethylallyltransferase
MLRALEVCIQTNKPFTAQRLNLPKKRNFQIIKIGLTMDRNDLYEKINQRVDAMIQSGLIEEAKQLYQFKTLNALKTVGYSELFDYFDNKISLETAIEKIKTNSRRYAKRQLTWFRKDKSINWFYPYELNNIINFIHYNTLQF